MTGATPSDEELIAWYKKQCADTIPPKRLVASANQLRRLARACAKNGQRGFAARLYDIKDTALLKEAMAIGKFAHAAVNAIRRLKGLNHYKEDVDHIQRFEQACIDLGHSTETASKYARDLRALSRWCFANNRGAISYRVGDSSLKDDVRACGGKSLPTVVRAFERFRGVQEAAGGAASSLPQRRSDVAPIVDLTSYPEEQQVYASHQDRSKSVLGNHEWLGDQHINQDYELLRLELERFDGGLAARTHFADPLVILNMRLSGGERVEEFEARHGTADFLFLPLSNAEATTHGTHWSLLLVDRSDRQWPVAYHYDSLGGHNDWVAQTVARLLNTDLRYAGMRQQQNDFDCGVFVVDGTRALVNELLSGRQPNLDLTHLEPSRSELQRRLSYATSSDYAPAQTVNQPISLEELKDQTSGVWRALDPAGGYPAGQPAGDSYNTANFWAGMPSSAHSPAQSVNQPDPPS
ncbi:Ulp1 family isopeptidase [Bradyrhizobium sp. Arg816]|uniref:Ulp1 family isopeptidase n=1 Tax=Bradyrhizobium sp. Arg816 TaxID=2998491 RepID=UPI00249E8295|nr:Ulp1 family isopeptidase [Bradyrhizobium sp. Arg816]MDI3567603.1 Ulp1 family isopeptidase [Bradyrhizobium sp. Arg816]